MKYIYTIILVLLAAGMAMAQTNEPGVSRAATADGKVVIEFRTIQQSDDSYQLEVSNLQLLNGDSRTLHHFNVPVIINVPIHTGNSTNLRRQINPYDYAGGLRAEVKRLEESDGELLIELDIKLNGDVMNRRLNLLIIPELVGAEGEAVTGAGLLINGWGKNQLYTRMTKFGSASVLDNRPEIKIAVTNYTDTLVSYNMRLPYETWMDNAVLDIHQILGSPARKEQLYTLAGAARVKLQPREPYIVQPTVSYLMPEHEQKSRNMQGQAFLDFASGQSRIIPTFRRNPEELAKIQSAIRDIQNDPDVNITGMFVEGYASPEGSYTSNDRLARERSQALATYISQNYGIASNMIRTSSVAEDWDGLRVLVEQSDLVRKSEVLAIIDSGDDPDRKEQRLRALGYPWTAMLNGMFPQLRRVEYQIDFTVKDYSVEESRNLASRNPEMLSQRELFILAQSYEYGSSQWEQIFETIIRLYPEEPIAILNYSSILLERGELAAAKRYLDRVADNPQAYNNLGVYWMLSGDLQQAQDYLSRASAAGVPEAGHNLEELTRKIENNELMDRYKSR